MICQQTTEILNLSVCECLCVSVYFSVCLSDCLFDGQDKFKLTRFIFIRLEINCWVLIICYCSQACLTRFLWCVFFRELYKELYQKQREEAEVEKQVSGPSLLGEQSSPLHHHKQVLSNLWLPIFVFPLSQGATIKQDYSRQGQEKKEERKVSLCKV